MSARSLAIGATEPAEESRASVAVGFLSMLPLFVAYELAQERHSSAGRNVAELWLFAPLDVLTTSRAAHWAVLALCVVVACVSVWRREIGLVARAWRACVEGLGAAVAMGPLLVAGLAFVGPEMSAGTRAVDPSGSDAGAAAAVLAGGAAYEELVFRLGFLCAFAVLSLRLARWLGAPPRAARAIAITFAVAASSAVFAAAHLSVVTRAFGPGGEPFCAATFLWRAMAGVVLGALFLWRGLGVAAWAHGWFNLALFIGAGPEVFL